MTVQFRAIACLLLLTAGAFAGPTHASAGDAVKILAFGDSLTAGYQLPPEAAFPVQLENALKPRYPDVTVVNAGVSGDTTKGGLARLDWALSDDVDAVILELGANDALRGVNPVFTDQALDGIVLKLKQRGIEVLIAGMRAPPNLGQDYAAAFDPIFSRLADKHQALLYPFFLEGVAADPKLNLADGMHPTAEGVARIVENILPAVEALIARVNAR